MNITIHIPAHPITVERRQAHPTPTTVDLAERVQCVIASYIGEPEPHEVAQAWQCVAARAERLRERGDTRPWIARAHDAAVDLQPA